MVKILPNLHINKEMNDKNLEGRIMEIINNVKELLQTDYLIN